MVTLFPYLFIQEAHTIAGLASAMVAFRVGCPVATCTNPMADIVLGQQTASETMSDTRASSLVPRVDALRW